MLADVARFAAGAKSFGESKEDTRKLISIADEHKKLVDELENTKRDKDALNKMVRQLTQDVFIFYK